METAAKVPLGTQKEMEQQHRASSKSQDRNVSFEPSSILKKETSFPRPEDMIDANLVAVSDPCDFKFDDELPEGDQHMNPEADDNSNAMRMLQSK